MPKRVAINGFGRIGRLSLRNLLKRNDVEIVAINDLTDNATLAHLFKFDTSHRKFDGTVSSTEDSITINDNKIIALSERDPAKLPWAELNVDIVLECTGFFRTREKANLHIEAGAKKVVISAPAKSGDVPTIVLGVNQDLLKATDTIISNASCTTNCLSPMVKLVNDNWGLKQAFMTTVHAYTADQRLQDAPHRDLRRARAAAENIVPTTTGAAAAVGKVIPEVQGKITAGALRVPIPTGSLTELTCVLDKPATAEAINAVFKSASEDNLKGILEYCEDPIVSSDIVSNPHSCIFDSLLTSVEGNMVRIVGWYDNEAGYSSRMADLVGLMA